MKNKYNDIDSLMKDIRSDIKDTLKKEVFDEVRSVELEHIKRDVFDAYSPKIYKRRTTDGLDDSRNIVGMVNDLELEVDNVTEFNDDFGASNHGVGLAQLVNSGDRLDGYYYDYPGTFNQARAFLDNTQEEINRTQRVDITFEKSMKKRGYDIK